MAYCIIACRTCPRPCRNTSTFGLTNATFPYLLALANKGLEKAVTENRGLRKGVNTYKGQVTHPGVANSQGRAFHELVTA